jgi:hypothetical protein
LEITDMLACRGFPNARIELEKAANHYRKRTICRVQNDLPGAFYRAPGKEIICRVPDPTPPGKEKHPAN